MELVRVEIAEVGLRGPGFGLYPESMSSALVDGGSIIERGNPADL